MVKGRPVGRFEALQIAAEHAQLLSEPYAGPVIREVQADANPETRERHEESQRPQPQPSLSIVNALLLVHFRRDFEQRVQPPNRQTRRGQPEKPVRKFTMLLDKLKFD